jgi:SAM-dependent methyltransferase
MDKDDFRVLARFYDQVIRTNDNITWKKLICGKNFDSLLDVGGGTGRLTQFLVDCAKKIYICDLSFPMLKSAKAKGVFQEICSSIENAPFKKSTFDCILMVDAFHHLLNQKLAIQQVLILLKPGGIFILEEPDIVHWQVKLISIGEKLLLMRSHFLDAETIGSLININEFSVDIYKEKLNFYIVVIKK